MWPFSSAYPEVSLDDIRSHYDYIILGGGTAGCVLANRLSRNPLTTVLLVESGRAEDTWLAKVPLFSNPYSPFPTQTNRIMSSADTLLSGRTHELISGKGLGGSSRVNAMLYTRGTPGEYNSWKAEGRKGWAYDDVLPLFKRSQHSLESRPSPDSGTDGEWNTRTHKTVFFDHTTRMYEAGQKLGFPFISDLNEQTSPAYGCAKPHHTMSSYGRRQSSFAAFLPHHLAEKRKVHLHICTGTTALKIIVKPQEDGELRAGGVYLLPSSNAAASPVFVSARREIILCAGSLSNPLILQRSGVGPANILNPLGIEVIKDLPGVGQHLQDHIAIPLCYTVQLRESLVYYEKNAFAFFLEILKYMFVGDGILTCPVVDVFIFAKVCLLDDKGHLHATPAQLDAKNPVNIPDIEIMPSPYDATGEPFDRSRGRMSTLGVMLRPRSTGSVKIAAPDLSKAPKIDLGVLSDQEDWHTLRKCVRLQLAIAREMRASGYVLEDAVVPKSDSDADIDAHIRRYARTTYHYSSSCRMAPEDDEKPGVVDDMLRVHGIKNLRIADCSIFPQIPSCHLQAPAVMLGEKCAELILADS